MRPYGPRTLMHAPLGWRVLRSACTTSSAAAPWPARWQTQPSGRHVHAPPQACLALAPHAAMASGGTHNLSSIASVEDMRVSHAGVHT